MLFSELRSDVQPSLRHCSERLALVGKLIVDFRRAFPAIEYSVVPELNFINAQALPIGEKRLVKIYGGLAYHPALGHDALAFALLHETGHHLANGPRLPWNPWLACECRSDLWATNEGAAIFIRQTGRPLNIQTALAELDQVVGPDVMTDDGVELSDARGCWASGWQRRKDSILMKTEMAKCCSISDHIIDRLGGISQ